MKNLDLLRFAGKKNGDAFQASEWNEFVNSIGQLNIPNLQTGKIEKLVGEVWTDATQSGTTLAAGLVYRLSGLFNSKITISGATTTDTKVILNGCVITTDAGTCIDYICESKKLVVVANSGTENYFIQSSSSENFRKKGAINSEDDAIITGAGIIYIDNAIGHGIRAQKLELKGENNIFVKVSHDGFHGSQVVDIYHGNYFVFDCNDPFGAGIREAGEELKLRGIIRVFGGNFHIFGMGQGAFVFDAKYSYMKWDDTAGYAYTTGDDEAGATIAFTYHSGFHSLDYIVDGPAVTDSNIANNFTEQFPFAAGSVTIGGQAVVPVVEHGTNVYRISGTKPSVLIQGYVEGCIYCESAQPEIHLNHAMLVAKGTDGEYANAIYYSVDKKNIQIQSDKGSEDNYVIGRIKSVKNIKVSPKANSVLFLRNTLEGSTIMFCNGGGSVYVRDTFNAGFPVIGTELWIGNDDSAVDLRDTSKNFKGDIYGDLKARLNSDNTNKGFVHITADFEGNVFAQNIETNQALLSTAIGKTRVTAKIIGETIASGKLFYFKHTGAAVVTADCTSKILNLNEAELVNKFK